jgi:hypothetical protein
LRLPGGDDSDDESEAVPTLELPSYQLLFESVFAIASGFKGDIGHRCVYMLVVACVYDVVAVAWNNSCLQK